MVNNYAKGTTVPIERSKGEIERLLMRYGAEGCASGWDRHKATIMFKANGRLVRFELPLPDPNDAQFTVKMYGGRPTSKRRSPIEAQKLWDDEVKRLWRALALVIKAKLEAVQSGVSEFEREFLAYVVLPGGKTVGDWAKPQLERAYKNQAGLPALLPGGDS